MITSVFKMLLTGVLFFLYPLQAQSQELTEAELLGLLEPKIGYVYLDLQNFSAAFPPFSGTEEQMLEHVRSLMECDKPVVEKDFIDRFFPGRQSKIEVRISDYCLMKVRGMVAGYREFLDDGIMHWLAEPSNPQVTLFSCRRDSKCGMHVGDIVLAEIVGINSKDNRAEALVRYEEKLFVHLQEVGAYKRNFSVPQSRWTKRLSLTRFGSSWVFD